MRKFIACLLLGALLGMMPLLLPAQQNQNPQQSKMEIEALKKRISALEKQLQTVENVEKMNLQAKLTEANAKLAEANVKLINAEFGKFERGLKDSNDDQMRSWVIFFVAIVSTAGVAFWFVVKSLIADRVEKNLDGFKKAMKAQDVIEDQLGMLEKQNVAFVLAGVIEYTLLDESHQPEHIKALREKALLQLFDDNQTYYPMLIYKAAEVLAARKSPRVVSPLLHRLELAANSDLDPRDRFNIPPTPNWPDAVNFLEHMQSPEAYDGLKRFLNHLLTENPKSKNWFLGKTVSSLVQVGIKLNNGDSVAILRMAIPHLNDSQLERESLGELARYFDIFNEPAGIIEILINHITSKSSDMEDVEDWCLELLQKHDPDFVNEWRARTTTDSSNA